MKEYLKYKKYIIIILIAVCGIIYSFCRTVNENSENVISAENESDSYKSDDEESTQLTEAQTENNTVSDCADDCIYVYVCGSVVSPGVYKCSKDDRIYTLIDMAGGFSEDANRNYLNLVEKVVDGQKVYVPSITESDSGMQADASNSGVQNDSGNVLVNINTATKEQLVTLPGIGDGRAKDIIEYREKNGRFKSIEDIKNVSGIKDALFEKLKDSICI